ncbi:MAG: XisI protein [Geitlerinemataceae cyanobacterium]
MSYTELVQMVLSNHSENHAEDETEVQLIFDTKRDRYLVIHLGWEEQYRVYGCVIHVDIREGKIWIQRDFTEEGIATELEELGVPKSDIILAFHSPDVLEFAEFSVS